MTTIYPCNEANHCIRSIACPRVSRSYGGASGAISNVDDATLAPSGYDEDLYQDEQAHNRASVYEANTSTSHIPLTSSPAEHESIVSEHLSVTNFIPQDADQGSTSQTHKYLYQPLQEGEIRILTLEPGASESPLLINLQHCRLSDTTDMYEALSYVWGDPTRDAVINCHNSQLGVTASLETALRYLRKEHEARILWTDGICINQDDYIERGHQIPLMRYIYPGATQVIVWLGEADEFTDLALQTLRQLRDVDALEKRLVEAQGIVQQLLAAGDISLAGVKAAHDFTYRPWFDRCWTFQEVVLSRRAVVVCGGKSISWRSFHQALRVFNTLESLIPIDNDRNENAYRMTREWELKSKCHHRTFLSRLLYRTEELDATDPRDKIFSFLALADFENPSLFQPSYQESVQNIYIRFTRAIIKEENCLLLLAICERYGLFYDLPSWVPDWSGMTSTKVIGRESQSHSAAHNYNFNRTYDINKGSREDLGAVEVDTSASLQLRGTLVDEVVEVHDLAKLHKELRKFRSATGDSTFTRLLSRFAQRISLAEKQQEDGSSPEETLLRTMSIGNWYFGTRRDIQLYEWPSHLDLRRALLPDAENRTTIEKEDLQRLPLKVAKAIYGAGIPKKFLAAGEDDQCWRDTSTNYPARITDEDMHKLLRKASIEAIKWPIMYSWNRVIFFTKRGYIGIGPRKMEPGDTLCTLFGADVPFILYPASEDSEKFKIRGECYVDGIMDGELFNVSANQTTIEAVVPGVEIREFTLV
ncbi:hypothetical protein IFR05_007935 [Cadophora sp. M221]|nr:hypothetical protein IFR05_007935 [Cadophora sp. M221]